MTQDSGWHMRKEVPIGIALALISSIIIYAVRISNIEMLAQTNAVSISEIKINDKEVDQKIDNIYESVIRIETILSIADIQLQEGNDKINFIEKR